MTTMSPGSNGNAVSIASSGVSLLAWWPSWKGRPNSCSWCGDRWHTPRLPGSPRTIMKPLSPTFALRSRPWVWSMVAMHAVVLPCTPSSLTPAYAALSRCSGRFFSNLCSLLSLFTSVKPENTSEARPIKRRLNSPASIPCHRHMYTPSATPKATTFFSPSILDDLKK